jgi:hypothetical protein
MHSGRLVFAQLLQFIPIRDFNRCVNRYHGNFHCRSMTCYDQLIAMSFAQLTCRESLREIETCLDAFGGKLYHAGLRGRVARSTLADANEKRDWRIWGDFAQMLIRRARKLYAAESFGVDLDQAAYAFDSSTISVCLRLFPWAQFRRRKGAVKLHTLMDLRGSIPSFIRITPGNTSDVTTLDFLVLEPGAFYVMDRGYIDFVRLYRFTESAAFFVTRAKRDLDFRVRNSRLVDKSTGLRCDQDIRLHGPLSSHRYPALLRRVGYWDSETDKRFGFLTNNFTLPALSITQLYHCRWQIELFFKWVKQHLRIKAFYGTSENAVQTQIWIAMCVYLLVAIMKKELRLERSPSELLQILGVTLFEKTPILQVLSTQAPTISPPAAQNQLSLFDF